MDLSEETDDGHFDRFRRGGAASCPRPGEVGSVFSLQGIGANRTSWASQIEALHVSFDSVVWDARG